MKNFVKSLVTNRFWIVFAALNVCYLVSKKIVSFVFLSSCEDNTVFFKKHMFFWMNVYFDQIMHYINLPAIMALIFADGWLALLTNFSISTQAKFQDIFLIFFITLQWLFIGWAAKSIAQKIRSN